MFGNGCRLGWFTVVRESDESLDFREWMSLDRLGVAGAIVMLALLLAHSQDPAWLRTLGFVGGLCAAPLLFMVRRKSFTKTGRVRSRVWVLGVERRSESSVIGGAVRVTSHYHQGGRNSRWEFSVLADGDTSGALVALSHQQAVRCGARLAHFLGLELSDETSEESRAYKRPDPYAPKGLSIGGPAPR